MTPQTRRTPPTQPEVLVVGAGPVGLTAAHELARRGIRVRLVDAAEGPASTSRALATHARSLEIYDQMGILPEMMSRGRVIQQFTMHMGGRRLARLGPDYSQIPTRYPMTLMIDQALTEEVLRAAVSRLGVEVEWGVRLEELTQHADRVEVVLRSSDGVERLSVPWLVGCDGGHSTVRKLLGLTLVGESSETWLIADAVMDSRLPQDSIHWVKVGQGTVMAIPFPERNKWRLLDTAEVDYEGDPALVAERFGRKLTRGLGHPVRVHRPTWISVFTIQQRMITRMTKGRCMVAGDAAHVHSPASGQGLNTGIQDAYNLGWKLAMVVRGQAGPALLDTYSAERVPVGEVLLRSTKTATALVQLRNAFAPLVMPLAFAVVRNVRPLRSRIERKVIRAMSALALAYDTSPLTASGTWPVGPRPGERLSQVTEAEAEHPAWQAVLEELRDTRWSLLFVPSDGQDVKTGRLLQEQHGDWLSVRTIANHAGPEPIDDPGGRLRARLGLENGAWLLVRPDGYLAARGGELNLQDIEPVFAAAHIAPYSG